MNYIKEYIELLLKEYDLDEDILLKIWTDAHPNEEKEEKQLSEASRLKKMKKPELQQLCREKNLKVTGTKSALMDRLLGKEVVVEKPKSKKSKKKSIADVLRKISQNTEVLNIRRNLFNNFEHIETGFVFNETDHKVVGKQNDDGFVVPLTDKDIETCQGYNFDYEIPENIVLDQPYDENMFIEDSLENVD